MPDVPNPNVIIPDIDDDDGDAVPDFAADVLRGGVENDLLPVTIKTSSAAFSGATLRVEASSPWRDFVRVFLWDPSAGLFRLIQGRTTLPAGEAAVKEIVLGVEAVDFAGEGWPPSFDLNIRIEGGEERPLLTETIRCEVAPFLLSCCLDPAASVHVVKTGLTGRFVADLEPLVRSAGSKLEVFSDPTLPEHDIWIQDAVEIGYAAAGPRVMSVALRGNRGEKLDDLFARTFLGVDSGVVRKGQFRGPEAEWIDWFGNLEVSPPLRGRDRDFPKGRIYAGTQGGRDMHPEVIAFLESQGAQGPVLWLDTSWLLIGHVDEVVSWIPSDGIRPFKMLLPSPRLAVEILRRAVEEAPGCILNEGAGREGDKPGEVERSAAEALKDKELLAAQVFVQMKIDEVRRRLQEELAIADAEIIEIPVLFRESFFKEQPGRYEAWTTNMVNSLLVGRTLIVPDPHGPLIAGRDLFLQAVRERLEPAGCAVVPVDNFFPYHRWAGEVHCGTNATRHPPSGRRP